MKKESWTMTDLPVDTGPTRKPLRKKRLKEDGAPTNAIGGGNIATFSPIMGFLRRRKKLKEITG